MYFCHLIYIYICIYHTKHVCNVESIAQNIRWFWGRRALQPGVGGLLQSWISFDIQFISVFCFSFIVLRKSSIMQKSNSVLTYITVCEQTSSGLNFLKRLTQNYQPSNSTFTQSSNEHRWQTELYSKVCTNKPGQSWTVSKYEDLVSNTLITCVFLN